MLLILIVFLTPMVLLVINNDIHTISGKISFLILGGCKFIILHMLLNTKYIIHNKLLKN